MLAEQIKTRIDNKEVVEIGKIRGRPFYREYLTEGQLNHHVHVVGASGYGKTVLLSHIIKQRLLTGKGLMFIDLKGDLEMLLKLSQIVAEANRMEDLQIFSLTEKKMSLPYNLVGEGTPTQLRDRIMMSLNWSEEYYKNQSASYLLKLLIVLCWFRDVKQRPFGLSTILEGASSIGVVEEMALQIPDEEKVVFKAATDCRNFLKDQESFKSLQGLRTQIESLTLSDFGSLITGDEEGINLFETVNSSKIIFFFLDSRRYGDTAKTVGRFILQDLKSASARVDAEIPKEQRKPFSVVIDEFADLAQEDFIGFLDRARSSRMSVVVAHQ